MTKSKESNLKDRLTSMEKKKKVIMGAVGIMALTGLGFGAVVAANAATPTLTPSTFSNQSTADTPTPGDTPDTPGLKEAPEVSGANDAPDPGEKAGTTERAGDTGPDLQQTGDHTEPGDLPDSP